jgi:hypothetical protein
VAPGKPRSWVYGKACANPERINYAVIRVYDEAGNVIDTQIGGIRVRSLTFSLDKDLEAAGNEFLGGVLGERLQ